jgi:hypothetical protein
MANVLVMPGKPEETGSGVAKGLDVLRLHPWRLGSGSLRLLQRWGKGGGVIGLTLESREQTPVWLNVTLPLLAVGATLVLCSGLILLAGANVFTAYSKLFLSALSTRFNLVETAVKATPLVFTGLAVAVAFRARFWNIGAEGQLLAGAMAAAFVGARVVPAGLVPVPVHDPGRCVGRCPVGHDSRRAEITLPGG